MNATKSDQAIALYRFLETEWDAMDIRPTAWCRSVGLADATVLRWRDGVEPDLRSLRRVAEALGRPLLDLLVASGYVTEEEAGGYVVPPRSYDLLEAIQLDQSISDGEREALRQVHDAFAMVGAGKAKKVTVRGTRSGGSSRSVRR